MDDQCESKGRKELTAVKWNQLSKKLYPSSTRGDKTGIQGLWALLLRAPSGFDRERETSSHLILQFKPDKISRRSHDMPVRSHSTNHWSRGRTSTAAPFRLFLLCILLLFSEKILHDALRRLLSNASLSIVPGCQSFATSTTRFSLISICYDSY